MKSNIPRRQNLLLVVSETIVPRHGRVLSGEPSAVGAAGMKTDITDYICFHIYVRIQIQI